MRKILIAIATLALVAAACAEGTVDADETTTTVAATTTAADTQVAETTSTAADTTTTSVAETGEVIDAEGFLASIQSTSESTSGRIEGSMVMRGLEAEGEVLDEVEIVFKSSFDSATGDGSFLMDMSSFMEAMPADPDDPFAELGSGLMGAWEFRQVGDRAYMRMAFINLLFGVGTEWLSMPAEEGESFSQDFQTMPTDPNGVFETYEGANATVEKIGEEQVNGTEATHYRITFDLAALADEMTAEELAELETSGVFSDGILPVDIWVDAAGYTVRMLMEMDGSTVDAPEGEGFGSMTMTWDVFDIGEPITVEVPPAADVTAVEDIEGWGDFGSFDFGMDV